MRHSVLILLGLLLTLPIAMADAADTNTRSKNRDENAVAQPTRGALPTVAKNQRRPGAIRAADCTDPESVGDCYPDYDPNDGSGGYTEGACNCYRICFIGNSGCNISTSRVGCKSGRYHPNPCSSCSISCI